MDVESRLPFGKNMETFNTKKCSTSKYLLVLLFFNWFLSNRKLGRKLLSTRRGGSCFYLFIHFSGPLVIIGVKT